MPQIGLKIWSTNLNYIPVVQKLYSQGIFDYIELFTVRGSTGAIKHWQQLPIPYILHAPHSYAGMDPSVVSQREANKNTLFEVEEFFKALEPSFVIFHPGVKGDLSESIQQFLGFKQFFPALYEKMLIENKPLIGLGGETCLGASPEDVQFFRQATGLNFCLDFGHAICYAIAVNKDWKLVVNSFMAFKPVMFHLSDGFYAVQDAHEHFGDGEYDLPYLVKLVKPDKCVSIETKKNSQENLDDFVRDVQKLKTYAN